MRDLLIILFLLVALAACGYNDVQKPAPRSAAVRAFDSPLLKQPYSAYLPVVVWQECLTSYEAGQFYELLSADTRQRRVKLVCHPALVRSARLRAESLAQFGYWAHCDPFKVCPNMVARNAGCKLPSSYSWNGNQIESLGAGTRVMWIIFQALANSEKHADHLFGRNNFFREQYHYGIAVVTVPGSRYETYTVVHIGICED